MLSWKNDLFLDAADLYLDSRFARRTSFISHAHSDHLGLHEQAISTPETAAIAEHRIGLTHVTTSIYRQEINREKYKFFISPAGHIMGSGMLNFRSEAGSLLYTGDFKLRPSLTVAAADPEPADFLVMETTYGLPQFRFPSWRGVAAELAERCTEAINAGRQPIVYGYSLGKSQEITRILTDANLPVTQHGAPFAMSQFYKQFGVTLGSIRRYRAEDFHGDEALDLAERGVLVAPPSAARSTFTTRFKDPLRIMMTGWALIPGAQYRYGVDLALPLSDHADFDELLEMVERVNPKKVFTHHGYVNEFAETLKKRGIDAEPAKPEAQLSLFG